MNDSETNLIVRRHCPRCGDATRRQIACRIASNNAKWFGWWCLKCETWVPGKRGNVWIPRNELIAHGIDLSIVPVVETMRQPRCARCGRRGAELHHWAPRAMFRAQADSWPTDYLCKPCHDEWHRRVTPQLCESTRRPS